MTLDDTVHYSEDPPDIDRFVVRRYPYVEILTPEGVIHARASAVRGQMICVGYPLSVEHTISSGFVTRWVHRTLVREIRRADSLWREHASEEDSVWHDSRDATISHRPDTTRPRPQTTTPHPGPALTLQQPADLYPPGWNADRA